MCAIEHLFDIGLLRDLARDEMVRIDQRWRTCYQIYLDRLRWLRDQAAQDRAQLAEDNSSLGGGVVDDSLLGILSSEGPGNREARQEALCWMLGSLVDDDFRASLDRESDAAVRAIGDPPGWPSWFTRLDTGRDLPTVTGEAPLLLLEHVTAHYRKEKKKTALRDVSLRVDAGDRIVVVGPSGAGKSTLCKVIVGEVGIVAGTVTPADDQQAPPLTMAYVPQSEAIVTDLSVEDVLRYAARLRIPKKGEREGQVSHVLAWMELNGVRRSMVHTLSGGERKRVSVALELLSKPSLLVMDEPTSGLDEGLDHKMLERLKDFTYIIVTHSMAHIDLATRCIAVSKARRIAYNGPPSGLSEWCAPSAKDAKLPPNVGAMNKLRGASEETDDSLTGYRRRSDLYPTFRPSSTVRSLPVLWHREVRRWLPKGSRGNDLKKGQRGGDLPKGRYGDASNRRSRRSLADYWQSLADHWQWLLHLLALPFLVAGAASLPGGFENTNKHLGASLNLMIISAAFFAMSLTAQKLVKDFDVIKRERRWGVRVSSSVVARALLLLPIAFLQAGLTLFFYLVLIRGPAPSSPLDLSPSPSFFFFLVLGMCNVASACLGLVVSAWSSAPDKAAYGLMLAATLQVALSGMVFQFGDKIVMSFISYLVPSRWGLAAMASIVDIENSESPQGASDSMWISDMSHVMWPIVFLSALSLIYLGIAVMITSRRVKALE